MPSKTCTSLEAAMSSSSLDESKPDTSRIQSAITACASGEAVKLVSSSSHNAFISGPLTLKSGVTLWVDKGVTLFASKNPRDFDKSSGACGVVSSSSGGCKPLIGGSSLSGSGIVGEGIIDGRGGDTLTGLSKSWWDLATDAKSSGKDQNCPRMVDIEGGSKFLMYKITLHNGPNFHVVPHSITGFTAWGVKILTPTSSYSKWSASTVKNTDGIDPAGGSDIVIAHTDISTGDDNIAIKGGSEIKDIIIAHNHFYYGHGMSIGSETNGGVSNVLVTDMTLENTDNGIRIKSDSSRGGKVHTIRYENVCMKNVGEPLVFDAFYSNDTGSKYPDFQAIELSNIHITSSSKKTNVFRGYSSSYPLKITMDNVQSDVTLAATISNAAITEGPGEVKGLTLTGATVTGTTKTATAISCSFPAFGT
jgi:polygalacturonase